MFEALLTWARCPVSTFLSLEVFKNHGHVALREVVSGHGGEGWGWTWGSEVFFNLRDSMIRSYKQLTEFNKPKKGKENI